MGMTGVSAVVGDTIEGDASYIHTKTFGGTGPTLVGGTSYYLGLGERYMTYRTAASARDDSGAGATVLGWSLTGDTCEPFVSTSSTLYLKVEAL